MFNHPPGTPPPFHLHPSSLAGAEGNVHLIAPRGVLLHGVPVVVQVHRRVRRITSALGGEGERRMAWRMALSVGHGGGGGTRDVKEETSI